MMEHHSKNSSFAWGTLLIVIGVLFLLDNLGILNAWSFVFDLWPVFIILIGLYIIGKSIGKGHSDDEHFTVNANWGTVADNVLQSNTFGDVNLIIQSDNFQSGQVKTTIGNIKINAAKLKVADGEKTLLASATMGDIKIQLPTDVPLKISASNFLGDVKIHDQKRSGINQSLSFMTEGYEAAKNKLHIICRLTIGDIKVS